MTVNMWGNAAEKSNQAGTEEEQSTTRVWTIVLLTPQCIYFVYIIHLLV